VSVSFWVIGDSGENRGLLYLFYCRYLEQGHDTPLQALVLTLKQEKAKLDADLSEALSRASSLEVSLAHPQQPWTCSGFKVYSVHPR